MIKKFMLALLGVVLLSLNLYLLINLMPPARPLSNEYIYDTLTGCIKRKEKILVDTNLRGEILDIACIKRIPYEVDEERR